MNPVAPARVNSVRRVLVIGARSESLGEAVYERCLTIPGWSAETAGVSGDEAMYCDAVREPFTIMQAIEDTRATDVVCTVGINEPAGIDDPGYARVMMESFSVNVVGPLNVLRACLRMPTITTFSVISSNSAQIARRKSGPYCASKAALSMALRVAAREVAGEGGPYIYVYEPGLLHGTPMTEASAKEFSGPLCRIPGSPEGLWTSDVADIIVRNIACPVGALHGSVQRIDGGEQ